ncbi:MAG: DCC1-like thiol-disulfide oxidoreductase family protein [Bacteroidota bacterium]|nr:DCC1-like thiol-disulfide oxidoreductase family protein [Bacteroidota bacterium]
MKEIKAPVILYDGVCNFCNAIVNFIIKYDKEKIFLFSPIQSREARMLLRELGEPFANLKTVYLINENKQVFKRSGAVFAIFKKLPYPWKILSFFNILPKSFSDFVYKIIAKYRYRMFGKTDKIIEPNKEVKARFLID